MEQEIEVLIDWQQPIAEGNLRVALRMLDLSRPAGKQACVAKYVKVCPASLFSPCSGNCRSWDLLAACHQITSPETQCTSWGILVE